MSNCALYVRVSTLEQAREGYSIGEQTERLTKYCESMDWSVYKTYTDAGYSGGSMDRPSLNQMISDIRLGKINKVVVYKLDRLSRSQKDTLYLIEDVFLSNNCDFVSMNENFDTSSPFGRAMIGILAVFSQLEREQIKERMMMGKEARAKDGKFNSGKTPIGYDLIDGELVVNDYEKIQIQRIFNEYASGKSPVAISKELNAGGYHHKYGKWNHYTIRHLLTTITYTGVIQYNNEIYQGTHEPIIDADLFQKVQRIIEQKHNEHIKNNRRAGKANSYLAGLLECGHCGAKYSKDTQKRNKNGKFYVYEYYKCNSRSKKLPHLTKDPDCMNKIWRMSDLDNLIFDEIRKLSTDPDRILHIREQSEDVRPSIIHEEIKKINAQTEKLIDLYTLEDMPIKTLQERILAFSEKKKRLESELYSINDKKKKKASVSDAIKYVRSFGDVLDRGDFEEIRTVLRALIEKIVLDGEDVLIYWRFA